MTRTCAASSLLLLYDEAMSSSFKSWEKDPLFFAAEQVQDAADRLESADRAWMQAKSLPLKALDGSILDFSRRELSTALGIARGQLEEFKKEVSLLNTDIQQQQHAEDDTSQRHRQFIDAISNQLSSIKNALSSSKDERDLNVLPAVRLRQEESDQLAHFLCGSRLNINDDVNYMLHKCPTSGKGYKEMVTSCQPALSMSSTGVDGEKALFGSLDECSSSPYTCSSLNTHEFGTPKDHIIVNRSEVYRATEKNKDLVCINGSQCGIAATFAAPDLLMSGCHNSGGKCTERPNGHRRNTSLGGDLSFSTERANGHLGMVTVDTGMGCCRDGLSSSEDKAVTNSMTGRAFSNFWSSLLKASLLFRVGVTSSNGLKRWKDGECDAVDPCEILHTDLEQSCSIFLCQDGGGSEMQTSQRLPESVYFRHLIRAISVTLAVVGLLGLYLH